MLLYECEDVDNLKHILQIRLVHHPVLHIQNVYTDIRTEIQIIALIRIMCMIYDDPEDFYYDNEDDFDGIDDAETYFLRP